MIVVDIVINHAIRFGGLLELRLCVVEIGVREMMDESRQSAWFVVETLPRREVLAVANLERQGFACFHPRFRKLRRHARRQDIVLAPLFPGYMFVNFAPDSMPWRSINGTFGVKRLISFDGRVPRAMPPRTVEALQQRCHNGVIERMLEDLVPGQSVRMAYGPFADVVARIERIDDKGRVSVLMRWLGQDLSLDVKPDCLLPA